MQKLLFFGALTLTAASQLLNAQEVEITRFEQHPIFTAQFILNQLGYDAGQVDGDYGPRTVAAIYAFYEQTDYEDHDPDVVDVSDLLTLIGAAEDEGLRTAPFSGAQHENSNTEFLYPPISPAITRERYWFGHFWANYDFNNDELLDFVYTGTMNPENVEATGEDTAGLCGGRDCEGEMPGPTLFLQDKSGAFIDQSDLFVDLRDVAGHSLARQNLVADFNGDDILDLFIADHAIGHHDGIRDSYFLSQTDGTWLESSNTHLSDPNYQIFDHGGAVGDLDADGDVDIVLTELANRLTCWINDGSGLMSKRICGDIHAFAIELGDMDGDGDLDLIHAGHEYGGSSPTGIALNDGRGNFTRSVRLPIIEGWRTVSEVGLWDLDTDGDLDIVLSRSGVLYVGTGVQVIENRGYGSYSSSFYPIVTAPDDYVAEHEGNEWNNFIENFRFHDVDSDGYVDVAFIGGGAYDQQIALRDVQTVNAEMVRMAYLKNLGELAFSHIPANDPTNHILRVPESLFSVSGSQGTILSNVDLPFGNIHAAAFDVFVRNQTAQSFSLDDFFVLDAPIVLPTSGAIITAMGNLELHDRVLAGKYDVVIQWAGREFVSTLCQEYYPQNEFLANKLVLGADQGFGGFNELAQYATSSCAFYNRSVAVGAWEVNSDISVTGLDAVLSDLNRKEIGLELILKMPMLTNEQRNEVLSSVDG
ncbi:MAG: FG-GAP-like repeat-containing protein [Paracoccaceae bacterium]